MKRFTHLGRRAVPLLRLATEYTAAHMAARLLAAVSGLLLVRLLPVGEYGFYTLVLSAFTFICTFSDLGATETLSFFRWRARKKNKPWVQYFHAVMRFRRMVFSFGFAAGTAFIFYTARHLDENLQNIFAGILLMGLGAWFSIQTGIVSYVLKLEQRFRQAYTLELGNEGIKLLVVVLIWLLGIATALAGMTAVVLGALAAATLAKVLWKTKPEPTQILTRHSRKTTRILLNQVVPTLPGAIHFSLQGVLVTWLAAHYGSVTNVAEVGALGRLGVLISIVAGFTSSVFIPRLIVITDEALFLKRYLSWWLVLGLMGGSIILLVWIFPKELLFLLGESYSGLHKELLVVTATAVAGAWGGFAFNINRARGWVKYQPYSILFIIIGQIILFLVLDFSTTYGIVQFGLGTFLVGLSYQVLLNTQGFYSTSYILSEMRNQ